MAGICAEQQIPLLIATSVGAWACDYWTAAVFAASNNWYTKGYLNAIQYVNYVNIPSWVVASMIGALSSANKAKNYGLIDPPRIIGVDTVSALTASIGVAAGKVIYKWFPKIQPEAKGGFRIC